MKYCNECGAELLPNSKFCSECGQHIEGKSKNSIRTGKKSINFIAAGDSKISTRDIYINPEKNSFEIEYEQVAYGKKIDVNTVEKLSKFATIITIVSGIITFITFFFPISIGALTSIPDFVKTILFGITILFCMIWGGLTGLLNDKNLKLPLNIEFKKINDQYISQIATIGECPICKGTVFVMKVKENNKDNNEVKERYIGICENNSEHRFTFDNTIFKGERIK